MGMSMYKGIGIPLKLINESIGHVISVDLKNGSFIRGDLFNVEDNWNIQLKNALIKDKTGIHLILDVIFIRGSQIYIVSIPDMLKHSPIFKNSRYLNDSTTSKSD